MSIECHKDYTIKIAQPNQFTQYWPFEVWPSPFLDMVSGTLQMRINPGIVQGPGRFGFGLRHTNPANSTFFVFPAVTTALAYSPSLASVFGVSFCYWINFTTQHNYDVLLFFDNGPFSYTLQQYWTAATKQFTIRMAEPLGGSDTFTVVQDMPAGGWHFVCVTLQKNTNLVTLYLDAMVLNSKIMSIVVPDNPEGELRGGSTDPGAEDFTIDEFGLSLNSCFDQSVVNWLYNSGAGRTWPEVSGQIPP